MRVYLDNNIVISIEEKKIEISDLRKHFGMNSDFVYSYIHIQELLEAGTGFESLKDKRLQSIRNITQSRHIVPQLQSLVNEFFILNEDPALVLSRIQPYQFINREVKGEVQVVDNYRERLVQALGIDIKRLNNYSVDEVIKQINDALNSNLYFDLRTLIDCMGLHLHAQIYSIFNMLDMIGYWKDEKTIRSNMARVYDSSHAYFAAGCDYFVSNDKRCRAKAKVAYHLKDIKTEVISWQ